MTQKISQSRICIYNNKYIIKFKSRYNTSFSIFKEDQQTINKWEM